MSMVESRMMGNHHVRFGKGGSYWSPAKGGQLRYASKRYGSLVHLLGTGLLYANSGTTSLDSLYIITSISDISCTDLWYKPYYINISLVIFTIGFLFKVSAAPFHFWSPGKRCGKSLFRVKLSNSGDTLELMIPSYNWKVICGWSNYSCTVISHKNPKKEAGYRGSKSDILGSWRPRACARCFARKKSVKEQRVYDNWRVSPRLRCILPDFDRNRGIKNPSKQIIQTQLFSTATTKSRARGVGWNSALAHFIPESILSPWFVTGFVDAEGCFMLTIRRDLRQASGWRVETNFVITQSCWNLFKAILVE